jgi:four helix bundle protein
MAASRFEDLRVWQLARELCACVYRATSAGQLSRDFGLRDQMQRASVSVMSNIAEGFERFSPAEFIRFLLISRGSVAELRSQLYVARDLGYIDEHDFEDLRRRSIRLSRMLTNLTKSIRR